MHLKKGGVSTWVALESVGFLVFQIQYWKVESGCSTIFSLIQRKGFVTNIFWKSVFICKPNLRQTYSYIAALCTTVLSYSVTCRMFGYLIFGRRPPALWIMIPITISSLISSIDFQKISGQLPLKHVSWCADKKFCQTIFSAKTWKICTGNVNRGRWRQFNWHTLESPPDLAGIFQLNFDLWCPQSRNGTEEDV